MRLDGARVLVAGATGVIGRGLVTALLGEGARVVAAGRDAERLASLGEECGTSPQAFDVVDEQSVRAAVDSAADELGGLDALVVTVGVAGFGEAMSADPAVVEELFAVNALGPMNLVRAASKHLSQGGTVVVLSAILADAPTVGMADYSAAKSALAAWLVVVRREQRKAFGVIDVRPPHLDTGLDSRALAGEAPKLPEPYPAAEVVTSVLAAMRDDAREVVWDPTEKSLLVK